MSALFRFPTRGGLELSRVSRPRNFESGADVAETIDDDSTYLFELLLGISVWQS